MATPKVKTTYALDPETVQRLEHMARRWGVSKSEALRRAIDAAATQPKAATLEATRALDELQRCVRLARVGAGAWARRTRLERRAAAARREGRRV